METTKSRLPAQLKDIDVILFDIQDVGARFYTYISTMYYVMEACAENNKEMIVLDRPNPCDYVEGPILKPAYRSFVGMLPIPVLHGCTIGELARMINGEGWIAHKKNPCSKSNSSHGLDTRRTLFASHKALSQPAERSVHSPVCVTLPV